jgi:hypothetical protein
MANYNSRYRPVTILTPQEPLAPQPPPVISQEIADFRAVATEEDVTVTRTFPIRWPESDLNDFQVGIRASVLTHCRKLLAELSSGRFPLAEVFLCLASVCLGAIVSALISGIALGSAMGAVFYVATPAIGCSAGVAYFMNRKMSNDAARQIAKTLLDELPDPGQTVAKGGGK